MDTPSTDRNPAAKINNHTSGLTSADKNLLRWFINRSASLFATPRKQRNAWAMFTGRYSSQSCDETDRRCLRHYALLKAHQLHLQAQCCHCRGYTHHRQH